MKKLLLLICFISWQGTSAQNWEIIQPGVNSKFQGEWNYFGYLHNFGSPLKATINIYPDSIITQGNLDFIYLRRDQEIAPIANIFYWGPPFYYIGINQPGRFGSMVMKSTSGDYRFLSHCGDTLLLKSRATLNQTWIFAPLNTGRILEASVINVQVGSVLGVVDSIKTIEIIAKDGQGQILISDKWNGKTFLLSKQHGLVSAPAFHFVNCTGNSYQFISDTIIYRLMSYKHNNQWLGKRDITIDEVFNLNIGDVFHFSSSGYSSGSGSNYFFNSRSYSIEKLISKNYFPAGDSLRLSYDRISVDSGQSVQQGIVYNNVVRKHDTLDKVIYLNKLRYLDDLDSSNTNLSPVYFISYDTSLNDRIKVAVEPVHPSASIHPQYTFRLSCSPYSSQGQGYNYIVVAKDLGIIQESSSFPSIIVYSNCHNFSRSLQYFSRTGETWGTPFDTLSILGFEEQTVKKQAVEVFPNPVKVGDVLRFTQTENSEIRIFNLLGHQVGFYQGNEVPIAPAMFQSGIYFWQLTANDKSSARGKFLVE
jgi:hypothetical protein